jgi:hypothetical protein
MECMFVQNFESDSVRFLLAALHLEYLENQANEHHVLSALGQLPQGLDATYKSAIDRITALPNPQHVKIATRVLKWLTFAKENLAAGALLHAISVEDNSTTVIQESDLPDTQTVISVCVGLVVLDEQSDEIRLVHVTTRQFFQGYFRDVRKEDGNAEIANVCLRYISFSAFSGGFENQSSLEDHLQKYKLSSYASRNCFRHIREGNLEVRLAAAILKTFENQGTILSVFQILEHFKDPFFYYEYGPSSIHLLHLASMHGLSIVCEEILRQSSRIQRLYSFLPQTG